MQELQYLIFDFCDEESGQGSFEAMASVAAHHVAAVDAEVSRVLSWAEAAFGAAAPLEQGGEWDYQLHRISEGELTTLTLTIGGTTAFCSAFEETFQSL